MDLIFCFDVCALLVCLIVGVGYFASRRIPMVTSRIFLALWCCIALSAAFDLLTGHLTFEHPAFTSPALVWLICCAGYILMCLVCQLLAAYCLVLAMQDPRLIKMVSNAALVLPFAVLFFFLLSAPLNHWMFYIDADASYCRGPFFMVVYMIMFYYLGYCIYVVLKHWANLTPFIRKSIIFYISVLVSACVIQIIWPHVLIQIFSSSLILVILFTTIQSPDEMYDPDSGVYSRVFFADTIGKYLEQKEESTVIMVHLDDLRSLSGTFGIDTINSLTRSVASYLDNLKSERVYALGSYTFAFIIPKRERHYIPTDEFTNEIRARFAGTWQAKTLSIRLSVRFFTVDLPEDIPSSYEIFKYNDYLNDSPAWDTDIQSAKEVDLGDRVRYNAICSAIDRAMKNKTFRVYYQPIYSTVEKTFTSAEALVRLIDEDLGYISPEEFIPIAEECGYILDIGRYVFESVCRFIAANGIEKLGVKYIEVNLSVVQCMQENLVSELTLIMDKYEIPSSMINLEITETAAMKLPAVVSKNISDLTNRGITFSLDDFGTGYANMLTLVNLPFIIIKIDKGVVWSAFKTSKAKTALSGTMSMLKEMNLKSVAEGIETEEMVNELTDMGCSYLQGFYYSKPVPENEYLAFLWDHQPDAGSQEYSTAAFETEKEARE